MTSFMTPASFSTPTFTNLLPSPFATFTPFTTPSTPLSSSPPHPFSSSPSPPPLPSNLTMADVHTADEVFDLSYHPTLPLFAAGLITGDLHLYRMQGTRERPVTVKPHPTPSPAEDGEEEEADEGGEEDTETATNAVVSEEESDDEVTLFPDFFAPPSLLFQCCPHLSSIRALSFSADGRHLYTASSDQSILVFAFDSSTSSLTLLSSIPAAHTTAINTLRAFSSLHPHLLVTGDDDGFVKVWDTRTANRGTTPPAPSSIPQPSGGKRRRKRKSTLSPEEKTTAGGQSTCVMSFSESGDYISDLCLTEGDAKLLSSSGDGHLQVFDIRRAGQWYAQSDGVEDDLLSVLVVEKKKAKGGEEHRRKILVGTKESGVHIYSWGMFGVPDEHFAYKEAADALLDVQCDSRCNALVIASSDGGVGLCTLWPHKQVRKVGRHTGDQPVESACLSGAVQVEGGEGEGDSRWLITAGHDKRIKMWDITTVCNEGWRLDEGAEEEEEEGVEVADDSEEGGAASPGTDDVTSPAEALRAVSEDDSDDSSDEDSDDSEAKATPPAVTTSSPAPKPAKGGAVVDRAKMVAALKRKIAAAKDAKAEQLKQRGFLPDHDSDSSSSDDDGRGVEKVKVSVTVKETKIAPPKKMAKGGVTKKQKKGLGGAAGFLDGLL